MIEIPLGLRQAIESGKCVLFVGAGVGEHFRDARGRVAPSGSDLARELAEAFSIEYSEEVTLGQIAQVVEINKGRRELDTFIKKRLSDFEPDDTFSWLFQNRWKAIYTTNYDNAIERSYQLNPTPSQTPISISLSSDLKDIDARFDVPIFHLHGSLFGDSAGEIIITEDDYAKFQDRRKALYSFLRADMYTSVILYIGYSNRDANWKSVIYEVTSEFYPSKMPVSYRIDPFCSTIEKSILQNKNIYTVECGLGDFVASAQISLCPSRDEMIQIRSIENRIPSDFSAVFSESPIAVSRLLDSWDYINQSDFSTHPNIDEFLKGDKANWGLIGAAIFFKRDLADEIYEQILDYATSSNLDRPKVINIIAPAGYGVTTLLMSLCARIVKDRAGSVFMHKSWHQLAEGDVEFASRLFDDIPIFVIDKASDQGNRLASTIHRLFDLKIPSIFILGSRINEWRQSGIRVSAREFEIEPLSDTEIDRLLDFLAEYGYLNELAHLSRDHQFAIIKDKHEKELLVAMREATEGVSFDIIIEDEYRKIGNPIGRDMYYCVCCFYQFGAMVRDTLLAEILSIDLISLYKITKEATEGVIIYEPLNTYSGTMLARARHRTIAQIVWERCGDRETRDNLLPKALSSLNLNLKSDKDSFNYFIMADRIVDSISNFEGKVNFYETACKKDPSSPYVRQHYARMLLRNNKLDSALQQIKEGLRLSPNNRLLYHTQGLIFMKYAHEEESNDIARKYLGQSESAFFKGLNLYNKDEYFYTGLAELYFGWAQKSSDEVERALYISKAENTIDDGLKNTRYRTSLYMLSSKISQYLGNNENSLAYLQRAIDHNPVAVIPRYLLARQHRYAGNYQEALSILEPIIRSNFEEFRCFVEYSIALLYIEKSYPKAISILHQGDTYGLNDPRYVATLGGMYFMNGAFTKAEGIFQESFDRNFTPSERKTIQFQPPDFSEIPNPLRLHGTVVEVRAGYAFIHTSDYPNFLIPGSKFDDLVLKPGLSLSFEPAFCAKGAIAINPKLP